MLKLKEYLLKSWRFLHGESFALLSENPYATHIPILCAISQLTPIQNILELGCGEYSTLTFLNSTIFPHLQSLQSFENDPAWLDRISLMTKQNPLITLTLVNGPIQSIISHISFEPFDLVFIDDSTNTTDRSNTIREVLKKIQSSSMIIIHDFENPAYRKSTIDFPHQFRFTALNPNTGLLWSKIPLYQLKLKKIDKLIKQNYKHIRPENCDQWLALFQKNL